MWPSNHATLSVLQFILLCVGKTGRFFSFWAEDRFRSRVKPEKLYLCRERGFKFHVATLFPCSSPIGCRHLIPSNEPQHQVCFLPPSTSESIYSRDLLQPEQSIHVWMKRSFTVMCYVPKTDDRDLCSALHCMWRRKIYHLYFQWVAQHK